MTAGYKWRPLTRVQSFKPLRREIIEETMRFYKVDEAGALDILKQHRDTAEYWHNDLYQVEVREYDNNMVWLCIRRLDGAAMLRDWRHLQQIKNELIGPECEAMELYPAESRKVDTSNKYHLYGVRDPAFRFPVGFQDRDVQYDEMKSVPGMRQRGKTVG